MKVLFIASEGVPFFKSGGLADVVGALPKELQRQGIDVSVLLPKYAALPDAFRDELEYITSFVTRLGWRHQYSGVLKAKYQEIPFYFIDNQYYFYRDGLYGYDDDAERYAFFCRAALHALPQINLKPDIIHLHDWQTGLVSALLKGHHRHDLFYSQTKTVFTIHNLKYQGVFPKRIFTDMLDLDWSFFTTDGLEFYDNVNFLKAGLAYSDTLTTVSPTYAEEIQYPFFGENLHGFLRKRKENLFGILNGIDYEIYDPANDPHIFAHFDAHSPENKVKNKLELQKVLGLPVDDKVPMIGVISRLVSQKGLDLIGHVLDEILAESLQLVVLGTGDHYYEEMFRTKASQYPRKLSAQIRFDNRLAHRIYAASDMFLMPSLFEPCGLSQLIALRYGALPIVRETGGLNDTVLSYNSETGDGNGFSFTNYNAHDMLYTIRRALELYQDESTWAAVQENAMEMDFSWDKSAAAYIDIYRKLVKA
ncbi:MAG: glycogen synthase GlgA [Firmicutes bacterium]|nr:glycogen synthase GlgA [Bacillota bacterium]